MKPFHSVPVPGTRAGPRPHRSRSGQVFVEACLWTTLIAFTSLLLAGAFRREFVLYREVLHARIFWPH